MSAREMTGEVHPVLEDADDHDAFIQDFVEDDMPTARDAKGFRLELRPTTATGMVASQRPDLEPKLAHVRLGSSAAPFARGE